MNPQLSFLLIGIVCGWGMSILWRELTDKVSEDSGYVRVKIRRKGTN